MSFNNFRRHNKWTKSIPHILKQSAKFSKKYLIVLLIEANGNLKIKPYRYKMRKIEKLDLFVDGITSFF